MLRQSNRGWNINSQKIVLTFGGSILLMKNGVNKQILSNICLNIDKLSFDIKQKLLFSKVIYAIYNADKFSKEDLQELYDVDFSDKDFYELLSYATNFMAKSKMIEVYMK